MLDPLPPEYNFDDPQLLKQIIASSRALSELKGTISHFPNKSILLDLLTVTEAKNSTAIENIITTYNEFYRANAGDSTVGPAAREAQNYVNAVKRGYELIQDKELLTTNHIIEIQRINSPDHSTIRKIPGTVLRNEQSGQTVYTPPQHYDEIIRLMSNLEKFTNSPEVSDLDPLIKMAIIHYQFESIHPFYDGNGRMGRILNVLYLTQQELLNLPVLYLSKYIIENKGEYYRLLQEVREEQAWLAWCQWLIKGIEETARDTIAKINAISDLMLDYKHRIREEYSFYSQDLINILFYFPYTKIKFLERELKISRPTAASYLNSLDEGGFIKKEKLGRDNFYFNEPLFDILMEQKG